MNSNHKLSAGVLALSALAAMGLAAIGCDDLAPPKAATADGGVVGGGDGGVAPTSSMIPAGAVSVEGTFAGDPKFYSWVTLDGAGQIATFSFSIPIATVKKAGSAQFFGFLPIPQQMHDQTPFKSFSLMYLPMGHVPAGVYDVPHWEWHLHTITEAEVDGINCANNAVPPKEQLPANSVCLPTCLEKLGMHGFNLNVPEFNGERFDHGVYAAYYDAKFIAVEPKILSSTLLTQPTFTMNSWDPTPLGPAGKYPKSWNVSYNADEDAVVLTVPEWFVKQ